MNKRNSQAIPSTSTTEPIGEGPELNMETSPKSASSVPEKLSRSRPSTGGSKHSTNSSPPSPQRQPNRASGTSYHASTHQQNLNAAAEMVVRSTRSGSTSGALNARPIEGSRSAPNFRQELARDQTEFPQHLQGRNNNMAQPKLKVVTDAAGFQQGARSAVDSRPNGTNGTGGMASPKRAVPDRLRPRRNTTTTVHQISAPINDPNARNMPLASIGGAPIPVTNSMMRTKRLSTGEHRTLPKQLADEIQKFQVADFAKRYFTTHKTGLIFRKKIPVEQLMSFQKVRYPRTL